MSRRDILKGLKAKIEIEVSLNNELNRATYWLILDPEQNMRKDIYALASQITGPFFSREEAQQYLENHKYRYSNKATVFAHCAVHTKTYGIPYEKAWQEKALPLLRKEDET